MSPRRGKLFFNLPVCCMRALDSHVKCETKTVPVVTSPLVKYTLVTSIPTSFFLDDVHEFIELGFAWSYNQDSGVEDIWPSDIRYGGKFMGSSEKMGYWQNGKDVCVEENYLRVLR